MQIIIVGGTETQRNLIQDLCGTDHNISCYVGYARIPYDHTPQVVIAINPDHGLLTQMMDASFPKAKFVAIFGQPLAGLQNRDRLTVAYLGSDTYQQVLQRALNA